MKYLIFITTIMTLANAYNNSINPTNPTDVIGDEKPDTKRTTLGIEIGALNYNMRVYNSAFSNSQKLNNIKIPLKLRFLRNEANDTPEKAKVLELTLHKFFSKTINFKEYSKKYIEWAVLGETVNKEYQKAFENLIK